MSNIFAGLEDLGFKNVEKVDVYQESDSEKKKQEAAKQDAKKETNEETPFDYASLYRTEKTEAYKEEARATSRARYGYTKSSVQGYNDWYYLYGNKNTYSEMSFDSSSGIWQGDGAEMQEEEMRPSSSAAAVRMFKTERGGNAVVYGNYKCADSTSASAHIAIYAGEKITKEIYRRETPSANILKCPFP